MVDDLLAHHAGLWAEFSLGFENAPFHNEWYDLMLNHPRLCVVAPRGHGKTQVFSVNSTAHHAIYHPGSWQYVFSSTLDQARNILERVVNTIQQASPQLVSQMPMRRSTEVVLANWSRVTVAGAGKSIRGAHPDRIVGDDVLTEETTHTNHQRRKTEEWWLGAVAPMAHSGVERSLGWGRGEATASTRFYEPTRVVLVGTPFHQSDLLMSLRDNGIYHFRRYSADFDLAELVPSTWAVEVY